MFQQALLLEQQDYFFSKHYQLQETIVFNAFQKASRILRIFCKATIIEPTDEKFHSYLQEFNEKEQYVRNFFEFSIYAIESSCGDSVPLMEYKGERNNLKNWNKDMDKKGKLTAYKENNFIPVDLGSLSQIYYYKCNLFLCF